MSLRYCYLQVINEEKSAFVGRHNPDFALSSCPSELAGSTDNRNQTYLSSINQGALVDWSAELQGVPLVTCGIVCEHRVENAVGQDDDMTDPAAAVLFYIVQLGTRRYIISSFGSLAVGRNRPQELIAGLCQVTNERDLIGVAGCGFVSDEREGILLHDCEIEVSDEWDCLDYDDGL